jgi:hypothetical protein
MLLYLDQNYTSRIAKNMLGQPNHEYFDTLFEVLQQGDCVVPPSHFHILELRGGYLTPPFKDIFSRLSHGKWVRPWQDILANQRVHQSIKTEDFLCDAEPHFWDQPASLSPLEDIVTLPLEGSITNRVKQSLSATSSRLGIPTEEAEALPFFQTLSALLGFRSLNTERRPHDSDLADLLIAATVLPYVDVFATDRFVREALDRMGLGEGVYSARKPDVEKLTTSLIHTFQDDNR